MFSKFAELCDVRLTRDRSAHVSLGFAFVTFLDVPVCPLFQVISANLKTSSRILSKLLQIPGGLKIDERSTSISYAHQSSFVPSYNASDYYTMSYYDDETRVVYLYYWDETAYAPSFNPNVSPEVLEDKKDNSEITQKLEKASISAEPVLKEIPTQEQMMDYELQNFYSDVASDTKQGSLSL